MFVLAQNSATAPGTKDPKNSNTMDMFTIRSKRTRTITPTIPVLAMPRLGTFARWKPLVQLSSLRRLRQFRFFLDRYMPFSVGATRSSVRNSGAFNFPLDTELTNQKSESSQSWFLIMKLTSS